MKHLDDSYGNLFFLFRDCRLMFSIWAKQQTIPSFSAFDSSILQLSIVNLTHFWIFNSQVWRSLPLQGVRVVSGRPFWICIQFRNLQGCQSQSQGCPPRDGIWRKPAANIWFDGQKPDMRSVSASSVSLCDFRKLLWSWVLTRCQRFSTFAFRQPFGTFAFWYDFRCYFRPSWQVD